MTFFDLLSLVGGLSLFLYGMNVMGDGLKKLAGGRLETFLGKMTSNKFKGFLLGLVVTAVIQSSSATTVMLVGFVNSGIMTLGQSISVIMGANIGTTVTSWLLSLTGISGDTFLLKIFKPSSFTPVLAVIGVIMMMAGKTDKKKDIGTILIGFAVLMFGMETMSGSMSALKESEAFAQVMVMFSNPVMGILAGTLVTAIIQSSSASVGILQAMAITGIIPYSIAIPVILGQNIGTTITPILSSISGNTASKRVAVTCLYFNVIGVAILSVAFYIFDKIFAFAFMDIPATAFGIAFIHTLFNVLATVILLPLSKQLEQFAVITVKGKSVPEKEKSEFDMLDERFLEVPSFAVENCRSLVSKMAEVAKNSMFDATALLSEYDTEKVSRILKSEKDVDKFEDKVSTYLVKIAELKLSAKDSNEVTKLLHVIGDVERISDHSVNILETAQEIADKNIEFSESVKHDIGIITNAVCEVITIATNALEDEDLELAKRVEPLEQIIDRLKRKIKNNHILRLKEGGSTVEFGFILSDLLNNYERIADHCSNIAVCLLEMENSSFETHKYLSNVKNYGENKFFEQYEIYKKKYSL